MNANKYIHCAGTIIPTQSIQITKTARSFFDPILEKERESERISHAKAFNSFLNKCILAH